MLSCREKYAGKPLSRNPQTICFEQELRMHFDNPNLMNSCFKDFNKRNRITSPTMDKKI